MDKLCGALTFVGAPMFSAGAPILPEVRIGTSTLKKARCAPGLVQALTDAPDACVYVFWHFHTWPAILGVKYANGQKYLADPSWIRASQFQYATILALIAAIVGGFLGEIAGTVTGLGTFLGGVGFMAGIGDSWWSAIRIKAAHRQAQRD